MHDLIEDCRHGSGALERLLLLHEGRSVIYVARQLGHDARLTLTRHGHVIDELDDQPRVSRSRNRGGPWLAGYSPVPDVSRAVMEALEPTPAARPVNAERMLERIADVPVTWGWADVAPADPAVVQAWESDVAAGAATVQRASRHELA